MRPANPADLTRVAGIVAAAVGRAPIRTEEDPGLLSVPVDDAQARPAVISGLQAERIEVTELALRLASLDEVFMALTEHSIAWSIAITAVFAPLAVRRYRNIG